MGEKIKEFDNYILVSSSFLLSIFMRGRKEMFIIPFTKTHEISPIFIFYQTKSMIFTSSDDWGGFFE
jgi:hypothetical protein